MPGTWVLRVLTEAALRCGGAEEGKQPESRLVFYVDPQSREECGRKSTNRVPGKSLIPPTPQSSHPAKGKNNTGKMEGEKALETAKECVREPCTGL